MQAIRENRVRAQAIGVDIQRYQVVAYVVSAAFGAVGGLVFVIIKGGMGVDEFSWTNSGEALIMLIVGGAATLEKVGLARNLWGIRAGHLSHGDGRPLGISSRITVLHSGRVIADGNPKDISASEAVQAAYLGRRAPEVKAGQDG